MSSGKSLFSRVKVLTKETLKAYFHDNVSRLAAALAFYTAFAAAPLLMLAIAFAGTIFEQESARERIIGQIEQLAGAEAGKALEAVDPQTSEHTNRVATVIGSVTVLVGAFGVFLHLQEALNVIWKVKEKEGVPWLRRLQQRLFSMATVVVTGFLLLVSLLVSAVLSWLAEHATAYLEWPPEILQITGFLISFAVIAMLFSMIFKILPAARVTWRNAWLGGLLTALLFNIGKTALGIYLANSNATSSFGMAGSLIVLLLWSYYASQIVFLGAEFTRIHQLTNSGRKAI